MSCIIAIASVFELTLHRNNFTNQAQFTCLKSLVRDLEQVSLWILKNHGEAKVFKHKDMRAWSLSYGTAQL